MSNLSENQHNIEILQNKQHWEKKDCLREAYHKFYCLIKNELSDIEGEIIELGSGVGNLKSVIPKAITTDLFDNPWIDQVENVYNLTFKDNEASNIVLFDVFHHLEYPGTALEELHRVLKPGGRIIIFEPFISLAGALVYGLFHHEKMSLFKNINWLLPQDINYSQLGYYAAQGNATRIFGNKKYAEKLNKWKIVSRKKISALAYLCTGGYSKPQMIPDRFFAYAFRFEKYLDYFPWFFSARLLVNLEKK